MENYPGGLAIYVTRTKEQAFRLCWGELLRLNKAYSLGWKFHSSTGLIQTPGGSSVLLTGADKKTDIEKLRGIAPIVVVLDEVASLARVLVDLIYEVLEPALEDYSAPLVLAGSPGAVLSGFFYQASAAEETRGEWSRHWWTSLDNPEYPKWAGRPDWKLRAQQMLLTTLRRNGWTWNNPTFQQQWLGRWCQDQSKLLYRMSTSALVPALPAGIAWQYAMGIDLGTRGTAYAVWAFSPEHPTAYLVWAEKHRSMPFERVAARGKELEALFRPMNTKVIDTGGLGGMMSLYLARNYDFFCVPAEKSNKTAAIRTFNDELASGKSKVLDTNCATVLTEWNSLTADSDGNEILKQDNHASDAALYAWRNCRHCRLDEVPVSVPQRGEDGYDEWYEEQLQELFEMQQSELQREREMGFYDRGIGVSETMSENWGIDF